MSAEAMRLRIEVTGGDGAIRLSLVETLAGVEVEATGVPLLRRERVAEALREVAHRLDTEVPTREARRP